MQKFPLGRDGHTEPQEASGLPASGGGGGPRGGQGEAGAEATGGCRPHRGGGCAHQEDTKEEGSHAGRSSALFYSELGACSGLYFFLNIHSFWLERRFCIANSAWRQVSLVTWSKSRSILALNWRIATPCSRISAQLCFILQTVFFIWNTLKTS